MSSTTNKKQTTVFGQIFGQFFGGESDQVKLVTFDATPGLPDYQILSLSNKTDQIQKLLCESSAIVKQYTTTDDAEKQKLQQFSTDLDIISKHVQSLNTQIKHLRIDPSSIRHEYK